MNYYNSLLVEAIVGNEVKTGAFRAETFGDLIPLVVGVFLRLMGCSGLLRPTVLDGTFLQECKPYAIFIMQNPLLFN